LRGWLALAPYFLTTKGFPMENVKSTPSLIEPKCKEASYARNIWCAVPDAATPFEDILKPEFWAHVAFKMKPTDRIEVNAEDGAYFAELMVIDAGKAYAKVALMRKVEFTKHEVAADSDEFTVTHNPHKKWRVIRVADKTVMAEELPTKADGLAWIANHKKAA
jgi:hypothetical protein